MAAQFDGCICGKRHRVPATHLFSHVTGNVCSSVTGSGWHWPRMDFGCPREVACCGWAVKSPRKTFKNTYVCTSDPEIVWCAWSKENPGYQYFSCPTGNSCVQQYKKNTDLEPTLPRGDSAQILRYVFSRQVTVSRGANRKLVLTLVSSHPSPSCSFPKG